MGGPEYHSGRAQRAGGCGYRVLFRNRLPILARHGRTSRTVAHGESRLVCPQLMSEPVTCFSCRIYKASYSEYFIHSERQTLGY